MGGGLTHGDGCGGTGHGALALELLRCARVGRATAAASLSFLCIPRGRTEYAFSDWFPPNLFLFPATLV